MNQPFISLSLRTAIELEKQLEEFNSQEHLEEKQLCEEKIRKIGELLTPTEATIVGYLRLRSEVRSIHHNGLTATNEYGKHLARRREFIRNISIFNRTQEAKFWESTANFSEWGKNPDDVGIHFIDEEVVQDTLLWIEPDTWHVYTYEEIYGSSETKEENQLAIEDLPEEVTVLATELAAEYFATTNIADASVTDKDRELNIASEAGQSQ